MVLSFKIKENFLEHVYLNICFIKNSTGNFLLWIIRPSVENDPCMANDGKKQYLPTW